MPAYKVKVKWGRAQYPDVAVNTDEQPSLFKAQLFDLTGVQPERQKVMCNGGILKDDVWNLNLKDGATILLMGSKENFQEEPKAPIRFIEDMKDADAAGLRKLPAGLINLGNTCYMNATVQCLKSVPELTEAIYEYCSSEETLVASPSLAITTALQLCYIQMQTGASVSPMRLLQAVHLACPQFSQMVVNGVYKQQDANECWSEMLKMLKEQLPPVTDVAAGNTNTQQHDSLVTQLFGGTFEVTMSSAEAPAEQPICINEPFLQLSCFISPEVRYMQNGLKSKMKEQVVKNSTTLGRDANYTRTYLVSRLPAYLTVQFVRFQYKGKEGINAKVLKDIKFPIDYDAYELCTPALQEKLCPMREKFKEFEDGQTDASSETGEDGRTDKKDVTYEQSWFDDDLGSNNSGYYSLQAVLTHKGRSSSAGHYVAWVRDSADLWFKFDDEYVSLASSEEVLRLSGGGDWHCAYVLLYGPKRLQKSTAMSVLNLA